MSYEVHHFSNEKYEIRTTSGRVSVIVQRPKSSWTIEEDHHHREFPSFNDALDCARELAGDPDLPPLTQM